MAIDLSTYAGRQAARDAGYFVDDSGATYIGRVGGDFNNPKLSTPPPAPAPPANTGSADLQAVIDAYKAASGFSIKELEEKKRQFDANLALKQQEWEREGLPMLVIAQRAADLKEKEYQTQKSMAQANLGLGYLKAAAELRGPENYFQQAQFLRGASMQGNVPEFLRALQENRAASSMGGATSGQAAAPVTMDSLGTRMTGMPPLGGQPAPNADMVYALGGAPAAARAASDSTALNAIGGVFGRGAAGLAPQALEGLSESEMKLLASGGAALGYDVPAFLQAYQQSRIGQKAASSY